MLKFTIGFPQPLNPPIYLQPTFTPLPELKRRGIRETNNMTREEIQSKILIVFKEEFEITNPGLDENLTEKYDFDSIDALELLGEIETLLGSELTREEKKASMDIRTINQICDYIEVLARKRSS